MDQTIAWFRELAAKGGRGVVNNIDARCLGRIADDIERMQTENRKLRDVLTWSEQNCPNECKGPMGRALEVAE